MEKFHISVFHHPNSDFIIVVETCTIVHIKHLWNIIILGSYNYFLTSLFQSDNALQLFFFHIYFICYLLVTFSFLQFKGSYQLCRKRDNKLSLQETIRAFCQMEQMINTVSWFQNNLKSFYLMIKPRESLILHNISKLFCCQRLCLSLVTDYPYTSKFRSI